MKNLQNNFTTPEQSKWLLELGVPSDSADCYLEDCTYRVKVIPTEKGDTYSTLKRRMGNEMYVPCWSVGRLMEICKLCEPKKYYEQLCEELQYSKNYCVVIISHIIANLPIIDFSKLED